MAGLKVLSVTSVDGQTHLNGYMLLNKTRVTRYYTLDGNYYIYYLIHTLEGAIITEKFKVNDTFANIEDLFNDYSSPVLSVTVYEDEDDPSSTTRDILIPQEDIIYAIDIADGYEHSIIYYIQGGKVVKKRAEYSVAGSYTGNSQPTSNPNSNIPTPGSSPSILGFKLMTANYTGTQAYFSISLPAGSSIEIDWGDQTTTTVSGAVSTTTYTSSYTSNGNYNVYIRGDYADISYLDFWSPSSRNYITVSLSDISLFTGVEAFEFRDEYFSPTATGTGISVLSGDLSYLSGLTNLSSLTLGYTDVSGDIDNLATLTSLTELFMWNNDSVTGDISALSTLTSVQYFYAYAMAGVSGSISGLATAFTDVITLLVNDTAVTGDASLFKDSASLLSFNASSTNVSFSSSDSWSASAIRFFTAVDCALTTTEVDNALIGLNGATSWISSSTLYVDGTNAARSSASDAAKAGLISKSVEVFVNE